MPIPSSSPEQQAERLRNQIGWITRVSSALSAANTWEDVVSILMAGMVSPLGLGYSRALYFDHDPRLQTLRGRYAIQHESRESMDEIATELEADAAGLEAQRQAVQLATGESRIVAEEALHKLATNGPWIMLFQQLNPESNPVSRAIERLSFSTMPLHEKLGSGIIFEEAPFWRHPRAFNKTALGRRLPPALGPMLAEDFVAIAVHTSKGLRGVVILDRYLNADPTVTSDDLRELEWFARQAILALENVEMNEDLSKAYQELKQLDQMKSNFLSIISHELRTPLTSISGFVELILQERVGEINENQRTLLTRVSKNTSHLSLLVNDLIEVAGIEALGTAEVKIAAVEPLMVLMDTLTKLENRRREQSVTVIPTILCDVPRILCDERALGRIFFHLIDNAMKFSPRGAEVEVRFRVDQGRFCADVVDHGTGIPEANLQDIFKSFYQVDNTLTRQHEGLGLGLAVTKMLLSATHGNIEVHSEVGRGSTFTVIYPVFGGRESRDAHA